MTTKRKIVLAVLVIVVILVALDIYLQSGAKQIQAETPFWIASSLSLLAMTMRKDASRERDCLPSPLRGGSTPNARRGGGGEANPQR
jgi:hypothetical protein